MNNQENQGKKENEGKIRKNLGKKRKTKEKIGKI